MKAVLIAAGRSLRMKPIADKNFLKFLGKPLIEHQLSALKKAGFREILIVGGNHNLTQLKKLGVSVREQKNLDHGMAGAVLSAASWVKKDPFFVVSSNDVIEESAFSMLKKSAGNEGLLLARKVEKYFPGGYLKLASKNRVTRIIEKPGAGKEPSKLVNIVVHFHPQPKALFDLLKKPIRQGDDMYEQALQKLFDSGIPYRAVSYSGFWQPAKYPWHVLDLMQYFLKNIPAYFPKGRIGGKPAQIAKSAVIRGDVYFADGVKVLDNAVIQGPTYIGKNTVIATNVLVRESHIGENCMIGFGSEVARSYIGDGVWTHTNYIGDSIIGNNISFGAGSVTGNLRLDEKNISMNINGQKLDSGRNKLGLITGDNIRCGINTSFMPGVKIGSQSAIGAGIVVAEDIPDDIFATGDWKLKIKENREKITPRFIL